MKLVFISSMLPSGHFSQILTGGLNKQKGLKLTVYTDKNPDNLKIKKCGKIKLVWDRNWRYVFQIIKEILKDKPDAAHIQQEFTMYGDIFTTILFPFLILGIRLTGTKVIVTIHAAVYKNQIDKKFISLFTIKKSPLITPLTLKTFFYYTFKLSSIFSNRIICHTNLLKDMLVSDYGLSENKVVVIPTGIPERKIKKYKRKPYFFYFGYLVRRKGIEYVLEGLKEFLKEFPNYKLVIAGGVIPGQETAANEIIETIKNLGIEKNIVYKGFVEDSKLDRLYLEATAVVIPARVSMGSSGPLYHAQSFGKCIIASNIGHFKEDINHLKDGILVDNDQWKNIFQFVAKHSDIVEEIEKNVIVKIKEKSIENIASKHCEIYKKI